MSALEQFISELQALDPNHAPPVESALERMVRELQASDEEVANLRAAVGRTESLLKDHQDTLRREQENGSDAVETVEGSIVQARNARSDVKKLLAKAERRQAEILTRARNL